MIAHNWLINKYRCLSYGKTKNKNLVETKGVFIDTKYSGVTIGYIDEFGGAVEPYIYCSEFDFVIGE